MRTLIHSALLTDERGERKNGWVLFSGDTIAATGQGNTPEAAKRLDAKGARLTPGFVDIHGHGGGGYSFDDGPDDIHAALRTHRTHGTTRSVISFVTSPLAILRTRLAEVAELVTTDPLILGSHLEGPFLADGQRGAHDPGLLREADASSVSSLISAGRGTIRQVTLAPELPGALEAMELFLAAGVRVAIGHTMADLACANDAFARGATLLTHAFNAMNGIHHRSPGPIIAALNDERVTLELILDGYHVDERVAALAFHEAPGRVALITDAMAAAGSKDGHYRLGGLNVTVENGHAMLSGTKQIAGSTLTLDAALRRAVQNVGVSWPEAVASVTAIPARALGEGDRFGLLEPGYAADAVLLDENVRVQDVWAGGQKIR